MKDNTDKSKYAVIYARFSSHRQTEQSIEGQLHVCYDYAAREGYTVIGEYIDRALTGRSDDRPDFQRMIKDSANKSFQYVIVYKLDRFSRDRFDSAMYKHVLKGNGVKVVSAKAKVDYLLSGKLFCGNCGSPMQGISGTGMTGNTYAYYQCKGRREKNGCEKKHEPKQALEDYVIRQTLNYILAPGLLDEISDAIVKELKKDAANDELRQMEKKISKLENKINKLIDLAGSAPPRAAAAVMSRVEEYTAQRELLETEASKLRISSMVSFTKEEVLSWLRLFCDGEPDDPAFRKRLVDVFINSIYVWDDKIAIYYNVRGGEQVTWKQALSDFSPPEEEVCISKAMDHHFPNPLRFGIFFYFQWFDEVHICTI